MSAEPIVEAKAIYSDSDSDSGSIEQPSSPSRSPQRTPPRKLRWTRPPITTVTSDPLSRYVLFDGSQAPYIEPHFSRTPEADPDYDALVEARWYEHVAEHYLMNSGIDLKDGGSSLMINTPVQLYLAHNRLARAQLEVSIYSKLLDQEFGQALRQDFQRTRELSLPKDGIYRGHNKQDMFT